MIVDRNLSCGLHNHLSGGYSGILVQFSHHINIELRFAVDKHPKYSMDDLIPLHSLDLFCIRW